jgi:hypothetical protein
MHFNNAKRAPRINCTKARQPARQTHQSCATLIKNNQAHDRKILKLACAPTTPLCMQTCTPNTPSVVVVETNEGVELQPRHPFATGLCLFY